nr:putative ubiquitin carboxyl-terminal hydrolase ubh-4 [Quercus suber]
MLKDMGVQGLRVQEVYGLDDEMLAILPQPVHALIFLFRYRATDSLHKESQDCPSSVWFANQTPDFACATFALLNIVNNIPNLRLGEELQQFKNLTQDMSPLQRGEAVDNFVFVKRIHNSFAKESELLQGEVAMKQKFTRFKQRRAQAKAKATREARKDAKEFSLPESHESTPTRKSGRERKSLRMEPRSTPNPDDDFGAKHMPTNGLVEHDRSEQNSSVRRSTRTPKPRQNISEDHDLIEADEDGFHFIAYMPINEHVWKLDGLDKFPQDLGRIDEFAGWMHIAQPALISRMAQYEGAEIQFNLMAVVHDPLENDREALLKNIRTIRTYDQKLNETCEVWRVLKGAETGCNTIVHASPELEISESDINAATSLCRTRDSIEQAELSDLVNSRAELVLQQSVLRAAVRDAMEASRSDIEKADRRRRDYTGVVRRWLHGLADVGALSELMDDTS